jgi:hypothetical protein
MEFYMTKQRVIVNPRDSKTGQFVTEKYAKSHPTRTTIEHNKVTPKPTKGK